MTSSLDRVLPWNPKDLAAAAGGLPAVGASAFVVAPRIALAAPATLGWAPPTFAVRQPAAARPRQSEREHAYEEGFAAGREAGRTEGAGGIEPALQALDGVLNHLQAAEAEFAQERERNLTALALVVARKLAMHELEARPEVLQSLVAKALELSPAAVPSEVRMHPDDLEALAPGIEKLALEGRAPAIQWVGDPALSRGSFLIDSPVRVVDGRLDSALRHLYERLDRD